MGDQETHSASMEAPQTLYQHYLKEGKLCFQRCADCRRPVFAPRVLCPFCGGIRLEWEESGGRGTVYATTAVAHRNGEPHNVVLVDLDEGFRMMSRVEDAPATDVMVGERVSFVLRFAKSGDEDEPFACFIKAAA